MDWTQAFAVMGVIGGFLFYMLNRLERDIGEISSRIDKIDGRMNSQSARTDQLYQMFVDLLKEKK
jgi:hypothetical protein